MNIYQSHACDCSHTGLTANQFPANNRNLTRFPHLSTKSWNFCELHRLVNSWFFGSFRLGIRWNWKGQFPGLQICRRCWSAPWYNPEVGPTWHLLSNWRALGPTKPHGVPFPFRAYIQTWSHAPCHWYTMLIHFAIIAASQFQWKKRQKKSAVLDVCLGTMPLPLASPLAHWPSKMPPSNINVPAPWRFPATVA